MSDSVGKDGSSAVHHTSAGAAFAHPCMGLFVKNVCLSVYNCLTSSFWSSFFVRPQDRFFVPTMRWRE
jgi:hypothetical protein